MGYSAPKKPSFSQRRKPTINSVLKEFSKFEEPPEKPKAPKKTLWEWLWDITHKEEIK